MSEPIKTWPEEIYLQAGDDALEDFENYSEVNWCDHPMTESDVRYVRADLASPPLPQQGGKQTGPSYLKSELDRQIAYSIALQRLIEAYCRGENILPSTDCPHHTQMLAAVSPQGGVLEVESLEWYKESLKRHTEKLASVWKEFNAYKLSYPDSPQGGEAKEVADQLYEIVERVLQSHRLQHIEDGEGSGFPLVDQLSNGSTIETGLEEITLICDSVYNEILAAPAIRGEAKEVRQYRRKKTPDSWKNTTDSWYDIYDDNPDIWNADPIWYDYRTIYTAAPASLGEAKAVENMESAIQKLGQERRVAYENPELNRRECYELYGEIVGIEKCLALFPAVPIAPALPVAAETNKDAERYRWLRDDERQSVATVSIFDDGRWSSHSQDDLDAAIDAARVQGEKG
jgi:hypothetical protein